MGNDGMKHINKVVTNDGVEHATEYAARMHLNKLVEAIIGNVVDQLNHDGCLMPKKLAATHAIIDAKLKELGRACAIVQEINTGLVEDEFND